MTKLELQALAAILPADILYSREAVCKHLAKGGVSDPAAALAYCLQAKWWCSREQFGVFEAWRDGKLEWRATVQSAPRVVRFGVAPQTLGTPAAPAREKKQPTRKPKQTQQSGLFN